MTQQLKSLEVALALFINAGAVLLVAATLMLLTKYLAAYHPALALPVEARLAASASIALAAALLINRRYIFPKD